MSFILKTILRVAILCLVSNVIEFAGNKILGEKYSEHKKLLKCHEHENITIHKITQYVILNGYGEELFFRLPLILSYTYLNNPYVKMTVFVATNSLFIFGHTGYKKIITDSVSKNALDLNPTYQYIIALTSVAAGGIVLSVMGLNDQSIINTGLVHGLYDVVAAVQNIYF